MNYLLFILKSSFDDFNRNKLRTFLTSLGILIGISSVILLLSLGLGLKKYIEDQFKSIGSNLIMVMPGKMMSGGAFRAGSSMMGGIKFDDHDVQAIKKVQNISVVAPIFADNLEIKGDFDTRIYETIASNDEIFDILNMKVIAGSLFDKADLDKRSKVVVLGANPAKKLFGSIEKAVGKTAKIEDQFFRVIGVLEPKGGEGSAGMPTLDDHIFLPFTSAAVFNPSKKYFAIYIRTLDDSIIVNTKEHIKNALLKRYHDNDFSVSDEKEILGTMESVFNVLNMVLIAIAAISLIVGGIGIMNIMYVSVADRIKEIGIRRAFGATENDILYLFLAESLLLSLIGGLFGLGFSYFTVRLIQYYFPAYINLESVILAIGVSSLIGVIFGVFPAKGASNLPPVEAIRSGE